MNIVSNCPLCEAHGLHVVGIEEEQITQCLNCGYVSSAKYVGTKAENEEFKKLSEEMQSWSKEANGKVWIPSMITLPFGTLYPLDMKGEMKWAFAEMIDIPEEEQKNYPAESGDGFYTKMYDTVNQKIFDEFLNAMAEMNERAQANNEKQIAPLPTLKRAKLG